MGDVKLASGTERGLAAAQGRYPDDDRSCVEWVIDSPSTTPSILEIHGATASGQLALGPLSGPTLSVDALRPSGAVTVVVETLDEARSTITAIGAAEIAFAAPKTQGAVVQALSTSSLNAGGMARRAANISLAFVEQIDPAGAMVSMVIETAGVTFALASDNLSPMISSNVAGGAVVRWRTDRMSDTRLVLEVLGSADYLLPSLTISSVHYNVASTVPVGAVVNLRVEWNGRYGRRFMSYVAHAVIRAARPSGQP